MAGNPFKFGSVVDGKFFTNRTGEIQSVTAVLKSENHLVIISPRRFGKTSLLMKVVGDLKRPYLYLDLQMVLNVQDLAAQLLKRLYRIYPFERMRQLVRHFRIIPSISLNPVTNEVDITFQASVSGSTVIEDVLNLMEKLSTPKKKLIVVLDEFQQVTSIDKNLVAQLRAVMQHHKNINYVFLGSQESLIREIFEKKKSPFYHFGVMFPLGKISDAEFTLFISNGLGGLVATPEKLAEGILAVTEGHPYYTQQLAFHVWEVLNRDKAASDPLDLALSDIGRAHDMDYERLWNTLNKTDQKILVGLTSSEHLPLSSAFCLENQIQSPSTVYSGLLRMSRQGYLIRIDDRYRIDDPFFGRWIVKRRMV
jgi:uncharacterized protein